MVPVHMGTGETFKGIFLLCAAAADIRLDRNRHSTILSYLQEHRGALAQMGERLTGSQEVRGSIPLGSTKYIRLSATYINNSQDIFFTSQYTVCNNCMLSRSNPFLLILSEVKQTEGLLTSAS